MPDPFSTARSDAGLVLRARTGDKAAFAVLFERYRPLPERDGHRVLPIFIGEPEGRAMAATLTGLQTPRPMTYQLAANLFGRAVRHGERGARRPPDRGTRT